MLEVSTLFPAGGIGTRMASSLHKPYMLLREKPLLFYTLEKFSALPFIKERILITHKKDLQWMSREFKSQLEKLGIDKIVPGGARRQDSVKAGLDASNPAFPLVLVHDIVRPFIDPALITSVVLKAEKVGGAIPAIPIPDTVKRVDKDMAISATVSREGLYLAQTPQCFKRKFLLQAFEKNAASGEEVTDEAQLLEKMGIPVSIVPGDPRNIKITTQADLILAESILVGDGK